LRTHPKRAPLHRYRSMTTYIFLEHFFGRVVPHAVSLSQLALSVAFVTSPAGTPPRVPSLPLSFHAKLSIQHGHYPAQEDSRGGLTSKIHVVVDGNGLPVRLGLTGGQVHDNRLCSVLLQQLPRRARLLADRGYDADWIRAFVTERGAWANIPPKSNRKNPICFSPISTATATWWSGSSTRSSSVVGCNPIRQARRQLSRLRQARLHPPMAARL
jgi:transposase